MEFYMKKKKPLVSVCMLCYNHAKYVAQSIQSVLDQTYDNWELVITDNASTDNSKKIIEKLAKKDSRIKFFPSKYNMLCSAGLNHCIKNVSKDSKYIAMISADDYYELDKIEKHLDYMLEKDIQVCFTWGKIVNDLGVEMKDHFYNKLFNQNFDEDGKLLRYLIKKSNALLAPSILIEKKVLDDIGLFDHRLLQLQDYDLWLRIIDKYPIAVMKEKLTCYRVRDDGLNLSASGSKGFNFRLKNESLFVVNTIASLDASHIQKSLDKKCDNTSKYRVLFEYYLENNFIDKSRYMINVFYNKLGSKCSCSSVLFDDFFEIYSKYYLCGEGLSYKEFKVLSWFRRIKKIYRYLLGFIKR
jgi:O-antigen biosynthesis protein